MKYFIFLVIAMLVVPAMAALASYSRRGRALVLGLMVVSLATGPATEINFWSMEQYRGPDRGFEVTLTDLAAASLALSLLVQSPAAIVWFPPATLPLLAYFLCAALSLAWTPMPLFSAFTIFKLVRFWLVYWVVFNVVGSRRELRAVLAGWMIAALVTASLAFAQKYALGIWRVHGPFDHSNTVPMFLNLVIGAVLIWALVDTELELPARLVALASVIGMLFAVLATFSRAGIALSALALLASFVVSAVRMPTGRTIVTGCVALLLALAGGIKAAPRVLERFQTAESESMEAREEFNTAAFAMVADHPLGVGINAFPVVMAEPRYREHVRVMANEPEPGVVHNIYLLTAAELGPLGLAAFFLVIARFLWLALVAACRPASFESLIAAALAIGMVTVHLAGMLEWAFRITPVGYQFAVAAGVAAALARRTSR